MTDEQAPASLKAFFKGGFRYHFKRMILHPELTPEQVALSFAIGFSVAWDPFIGLHTFAILLLCFIFKRLHRPLMLLACFINNPWTMVPMASASALVGNILLGRGLHLNLKGVHWHEITWRSFISREGLDGLLKMLEPVLVPYLLGGLLLSALTLPLGYYGMLYLARRLRRVHLHMPHLRHPKPPSS